MELQQGVLFVQMPSAKLERKQERHFFSVGVLGDGNSLRWKQMYEDDILIPFYLIGLIFILVRMILFFVVKI